MAKYESHHAIFSAVCRGILIILGPTVVSSLLVPGTSSEMKCIIVYQCFVPARISGQPGPLTAQSVETPPPAGALRLANSP